MGLRIKLNPMDLTESLANKGSAKVSYYCVFFSLFPFCSYAFSKNSELSLKSYFGKRRVRISDGHSESERTEPEKA